MTTLNLEMNSTETTAQLAMFEYVDTYVELTKKYEYTESEIEAIVKEEGEDFNLDMLPWLSIMEKATEDEIRNVIHLMSLQSIIECQNSGCMPEGVTEEHAVKLWKMHTDRYGTLGSATIVDYLDMFLRGKDLGQRTLLELLWVKKSEGKLEDTLKQIK